MGFRLNRTYNLVFEDELDGLEVKIKSTPTAAIMRLREISTTDAGDLVDMLVEYIVEWNYEDADGNPVKVDREAILAELETPVLAEIAKAWYRAAAGISAPLGRRSTGGSETPEAGIPMEVL